MSPTTPNISKVVLGKLRHLRRKLTGWILVHGIGRWLMVLLIVLAVDMLLDRVFKMDFAQRLIMLAVMTLIVIAYFAWRVIRPLLARPNDDALIYQVESKNPELKENLITGWQLAKQKDLAASGTSPELVAATMQSGIERVQQIDFGKSLDLSHHRQNWLLLLGALAVSAVLAVGVSRSDFLRTWFNRNVLLADDQWPQGTYLKISGANDGQLILPRGIDHRQIVMITEDSAVADVGVSIEIDTPGGRTIHQMKSTGKLDGREQAYVFHNVSSEFRFRATGGDDVTEWIDVKLVEPPAVIDLVMTSFPPEYTGIKSEPLAGNGPYSVLGGSRLQVEITGNKKLGSASLGFGDEQSAMQIAPDENQFAITIEPTDLRGGEYKIELVDEAGLRNSRATKFVLSIKEDKPPKVRASLLGISGLVVPRAMLPTSYQMADEYGLTRLYFASQWKAGDQEEAVKRQIDFADLSPRSNDEDGAGPIREANDVAVLDLLPLNLEPGTSFRFSVAAEDTRPDVPGVGRSQEFLLRVVSDEELRADLLRREIEQRKAFEQAYEVQMELATEIQAVAARQQETGENAEQFQAQRESELIALVRSQKSVGTAVARVADRFEEFLVEVKNNRLDEAENAIAPGKKIETRFDQGIIQPIRQLDQELISLATRNLDNCRRAANNEDELLQSVDQTALVHQQVLEEMKRILDAMNDSENFQEIINDLLEIKEDTNRVGTEIDKKLKPKNIFDDNEDIFDK